MNTQEEFEFAGKLIQELKRSTREIDAQTAAKIRQARNQALARYHADRVRAWYPQWAVDGLSSAFAPFGRNLRPYAAALILFASLSGVIAWQIGEQQDSEDDEIEQALLTDELPVVAYLDKDFGSWMKRPSH
jgi:hypothetical protein